MAYEQHEGADNVFDVGKADQQMNWAMEKARLTLPYFKRSLLDPQPEQYGFSLKVRLEDANGVEHIWMNDLSIDEDGIFYGIIDSDPVTVKSVVAGTKIGIDLANISDWLIVEDGRLIGGYTIRVYRESLGQQEKLHFDQGFGIVIDYGVDHFPHDFSTPEGAILCLEDAYTNGDVEAACACKDFPTEARMLLSRVPGMEEADEDMVTQTAELLKLSFEAHLKANDLVSFEGVQRAFPEREFIDKDTVVITEICYHPDGRSTVDRLVVTRFGEEWRVGPPLNEEEGEE